MTCPPGHAITFPLTEGDWGKHADCCSGFDLLESDDGKALTEFSLMWSDLLELRIVPLVEDAEVTDVLKRAGK